MPLPITPSTPPLTPPPADSHMLQHQDDYLAFAAYFQHEYSTVLKNRESVFSAIWRDMERRAGLIERLYHRDGVEKCEGGLVCEAEGLECKKAVGEYEQLVVETKGLLKLLDKLSQRSALFNRFVDTLLDEHVPTAVAVRIQRELRKQGGEVAADYSFEERLFCLDIGGGSSEVETNGARRRFGTFCQLVIGRYQAMTEKAKKDLFRFRKTRKSSSGAALSVISSTGSDLRARGLQVADAVESLSRSCLALETLLHKYITVVPHDATDNRTIFEGAQQTLNTALSTMMAASTEGPLPEGKATVSNQGDQGEQVLMQLSKVTSRTQNIVHRELVSLQAALTAFESSKSSKKSVPTATEQSKASLAVARDYRELARASRRGRLKEEELHAGKSLASGATSNGGQ